MADAPAPPSAALSALFALLPDQPSNPIGTLLKQKWLDLAKVHLAGSPAGNVTPDCEFRWTFYGGLRNPDTAVEATLGIDWWRRYAITLAAAGAYQYAQSIRGEIDVQAVHADLAALNLQLYSTARAGYLAVFNEGQAAAISAAAAGNAAAARSAYLGILTSTAWITGKRAAFVSGSWTNATWEMFHHSIKLSALGTSNDDITHMLSAVAAGGLTLPANFTAANWLSYPVPVAGWPISVNDLPASGFTTEAVPKGSVFGNGFTDGIADWFIESTKYYIPPKTSCFTPATRVLMADGTDRPIDSIRPGDVVWSPAGPTPVRVAPRAARASRRLTGITIDGGSGLNGTGFGFADSHPVVDGGSPQQLGIVSRHPVRGAGASPGAGDYGSAALDPGTRLVLVTREGERSIGTLAGVVDVEPTAKDDELVDLILAPGPSGFPPYAIGPAGSDTFMLVRSEVLRYERHPYGCAVGLEALAGSLDTLLAAIAPLRADESAVVYRAMKSAAPLAIADALQRVGARSDEPGAAEPTRPVHELLDELLASFHAADGSFNQGLGLLQEVLATTQLAALDHVVRSGWQVAPLFTHRAGVAIVTVHDLVGEGHYPLDGEWEIELSVETTRYRLAVEPAGHATHHRAVNRAIVVPLDDGQSLVGLERLTVVARRADGTLLSGGWASGARSAIGVGYRHASVGLGQTACGPVDAVLRFDVRHAASGDDALTEPPPSWDESARLRLARRLGPALAATLARWLPLAVSAQTAVARQPAST